jgi:hypothetical protein
MRPLYDDIALRCRRGRSRHRRNRRRRSARPGGSASPQAPFRGNLRALSPKLKVDAHSARLTTLFSKALDRIDEALDSKKVVVVSTGKGLTEACELDQADHQAQMAAVQRLWELYRLGRRGGELDSAQGQGVLTFDQFYALRQEVVKMKREQPR